MIDLLPHLFASCSSQILFGVSIYENIRWGQINATRAEIEEAARQANAHAFIMKLPQVYITKFDYFVFSLSLYIKQLIIFRNMKHWWVNVVSN